MLSAAAATGSAFINNAGANALDTPNGRFLVFTDTVGDVAAGGLAADPLYGFSFAAYTPGSLADFGGNRFVYAESETLTVMPGSSTVTYDGRTQTAPPSFAVTGLVAGDTLAAAVSGAAGFTGGSGRNAGTYGLKCSARHPRFRFRLYLRLRHRHIHHCAGAAGGHCQQCKPRRRHSRSDLHRKLRRLRRG